MFIIYLALFKIQAPKVNNSQRVPVTLKKRSKVYKSEIEKHELSKENFNYIKAK